MNYERAGFCGDALSVIHRFRRSRVFVRSFWRLSVLGKNGPVCRARFSDIYIQVSWNIWASFGFEPRESFSSCSLLGFARFLSRA